MEINKGKCPHCDQDMIVEVKQPTIVVARHNPKGSVFAILSAGREPNVFTILHSDEVNTKDYYQLGKEFRTWWDNHIAGGFDDGFREV